MDRPISYESRGWCPHATYLEDGHVLSPPNAHVEFVARSLLCMSNYFILQLRQEYGVILDSDAFLGAFSMDREGQRVKMGPWPLGPGHRPQEPPVQSTTILPTDYKLISQDEIRASMCIKWEKYYWHSAGHIPYAICKANGAPPLDVETDNGHPPLDNNRIDEDEEQDIETGGIGFDQGDSEVDPQPRRLGGRPLKREHN